MKKTIYNIALVLSLFTICTPLLAEKKAIIFGVRGQDGSYLAELLLNKGYEVHGIVRKDSTSSPEYWKECLEKFAKKKFLLHEADLTSYSNLNHLISCIVPDEIYNLAALSRVSLSFKFPIVTGEINALGPMRILKIIRDHHLENKTRFFQASSSEMFGQVREVPQKESTPFYPKSPYGVAKLYAHWNTVNFRETYNMYAVNGILFNHESERRGKNFVTRKITLAAARIKKGLQDVLYLGNLNVSRDWSYAKDVVECMWLMLQQEIPQDFIIGSGETHSLRDFVKIAFKEVGYDLIWKGKGIDEIGIDKNSGQVLVKVNPEFFRPIEVNHTLADPSRAKKLLNWSNKTSFEDLVRIMVQHDLEKI